MNKFFGQLSICSCLLHDCPHGQEDETISNGFFGFCVFFNVGRDDIRQGSCNIPGSHAAKRGEVRPGVEVEPGLMQSEGFPLKYEVMGREVAGGIRMGNICKSMADSCQCMAKTTTIL